MASKQKRVPPASTASNARAVRKDESSGGILTQLTPREILLCIRERALAAATLAIVICALLGGLLLSKPKLYQTQARLLLDRKERVLNMDQVMDQSITGGRNDAMFDTYLQQIVSPAMVARVVATLSNEEKERAWRPYASHDAPVPDKLDSIVRGIISRNADAYRQGNTFFIGINVRHRDPQIAALLATRIAKQFILYQLDRNTSVNNSAIAFLREQTEDLRTKAEASELALQKYRESTGMVSLDESRNIVVDRMKLLSSTVTQARVARLAVEARLQQAEAILNGSGDPLELATTAEFSSLANVQTQIDDLNTKRAIMAERYGARHPAMVDNTRTLDALKKLRSDLITTAMANLRNQQAKASNEEKQLQTELAAAERESLRLDEMSIQFNVLRRDAETNRSTYAQLLNRLNETTVTARLESSNIRLSDEAMVPYVSIEPDTRKISLLLVFLGLSIFIIYPVSLELLFNRVRGWADVESYLKMQLLGEIPSFKKIGPTIRPHILTRSGDEEAQESIRSLYSQLKLSSHVEVPKTIMVTSTLPSEGKSFVASNLAAAFAAHGHKTLLLDTDLRRPSQHRSFSFPNELGLLHWLKLKKPIPENPLEDPDLGIHLCSENLHLLCTGGSTRRSTEVLDSEVIGRLISALQNFFEVVIIDTPPAGVFPDALALANHADELIYVVRHNHVSRPAVRRIIERIRETGIEQPGIVLNMMPAGRRSAAHYSGYGYYGSKYYDGYHRKKES
jgi:polysaccharide biosynthesis transport protein